MGDILIIFAVIIILILVFIFLTFSIFWGLVIFFIAGVFSFFTSFFDGNSEKYETIQPDPSSVIICIDSQKNSYKLSGENFIIKFNKSDGSKYIVTDNGSKFNLENCFYLKGEDYL
jgi:hypothetical protein